MRKVVLLLASIALAVLLASGVALAAKINCSAGEASCKGTNEPDTLNGSQKNDRIHGRLGDDTIYGKGGDDVLRGDGDNDKIYGSIGNDRLAGGPGNDTMRGGKGSDTVFAARSGVEKGDEAGDDRVYGNGGDDIIIDREGYNLLSGGSGKDQLGGSGTLLGGPGADKIYGTLLSGSGDDQEVYGTLTFRDPVDNEVLTTPLMEPADDETSIHSSARDSSRTNKVVGGPGNDIVRLYGPGELIGGPGNDELVGLRVEIPGLNGEGPRVFRGGAGKDTIRSSDNNPDTIYLRDGERDLVISCGGGKDTVYFDKGLDKFSPNSRCERRIGR